jgi:hypothetical protein
MSVCDFCFCERPFTTSHESFIFLYYISAKYFYNTLLRGTTKDLLKLVEIYYCAQYLIKTKNVFIYSVKSKTYYI